MTATVSPIGQSCGRRPARIAKLARLHLELAHEVERIEAEPFTGGDRLHAAVLAASLHSLLDQLDALLNAAEAAAEREAECRILEFSEFAFERDLAHKVAS